MIEVTEHESLTEYARQKVEDMAREEHIAYLLTRYRGADKAAANRYWWPQLQAAINARSPEQVLRMEVLRGIR